MTARFLTLAFIVAGALTGAGCTPGRNDCNDGLDNDADGLIDSADLGCELNGNTEAPDPTKPRCNDGVDNDGDALVDLEDPGCDGEDDDDEFNEPPKAACADGLDNDGDGRIDYPNDPGCGNALEDDETDDCPDGPGCPSCADGVDNDGDGMADFPTDPGCSAASDNDEFNTIPGVCGPGVDVSAMPPGGIVTGVHTGGVANELESSTCGGRGGETVYTINVEEPASLYITTDFPETTLDTVVYLRGDCRNPETEVECNDDSLDRARVSTLLVPRVEPGTYYIVVDAFGPGSVGDFKLEARTFKGEGEECDPDAVPGECPPGLVCRLELPGSAAETCVPTECADGNDNDGDGLTDFPEEPGCTAEADNDEADDCPAGANCPQCGNGLDDDGDTFSDYPADPGCASASDDIELDECVPGVQVLGIPGGVAMGTTVGGSTMFTASCDSDSSMSPERIHGFRVTFPLVSLRFTTEGSAFDNTLYVRQGTCDVGPDVACAANTTGTDSQSVTIATPAVDENYYVFVDGDWSTSGAYTLQVFGKIPGGDPCTPGDTHFTCELGYMCDGGTSTCVTAVCNDGMDNDGDGDADWPNDPGCTDASDASEADDCPDGAGCPECGNGVDDDGDGLADYPDDPGCQHAADGAEIDECIAGFEVLDLNPETGATGTTSGASSFAGSCASSSSSAEVVYAYRLTRALSSLTVDTTASSFDTVTYVRLDTCNDAAAEIACADPGSGGETLTIDDPALGTYFVFVDGNFSSGSYDLQLRGTIPPGDACDPAATAFRCEPGYLCAVGSETCVATQCNDGADNDGDSLADAADPGCSSVLDDSESPDPSPLPECADGVDNDADGAIDYPDDPGCSRAADDLEIDCEDSDPIVEVSLPATTGTTVGAAHDFSPSCLSTSTAPEIVHQLKIPGQLDSLTIDTYGSSYDTALYMKEAGCIGADLACDDDDGGLQSRIHTAGTGTAQIPSPVPAGDYFIFVDGFSSSSGAYTLNITGVITAGELCDPDQVTAGVLSCASGSCIDAGGGEFRCM